MSHATKLLLERSEAAVQLSVRALVAGHPLTLVIDTGGARSMIPAGFVRKYHLPIKSTTADIPMVDANGTELSMPRAPGLTVQFEGETTIDTADFLVNRAMGSETTGILVPQEMVRSGWAAVLDFEHGELRYEPEASALKRLAAEASPLQEIDYRTCEFDNHRVTSVLVNGIRTSLLLDTGATYSALLRNNEAIPSLAAMKGRRGATMGLFSQGQQLLVEGIPVEFAKTSFKVTAMVVPRSDTCFKGVLGADVLSQCTIVWGSSSLWASCRPQSQRQ